MYAPRQHNPPTNERRQLDHCFDAAARERRRCEDVLLDEETRKQNEDWFEDNFVERIRVDDPDLVRVRTIYLRPGLRGDEVAESIADALRWNHHVRVVDLSNLFLTCSGVKALASALLRSCTVEEIDLSGNDVGTEERGASVLADLIGGTVDMAYVALERRVALRRTGLSPEGAMSILLAAVTSASLRSLVLEEPEGVFRSGFVASLVDILGPPHTSAMHHDVTYSADGFVRIEVTVEPRELRARRKRNHFEENIEVMLKLCQKGRFRRAKDSQLFGKFPLFTLLVEAEEGFRPWSEVLAWVELLESFPKARAMAVIGVPSRTTLLHNMCAMQGVPLDVFKRILALAPEMAQTRASGRISEFDWYCQENTAYRGALPLHCVAAKPDGDNIEAMQCLIKAFPPALTYQNKLGWVPLQCAMHARHWESVKLLLGEDGEAARVVDEFGSSALHFAARKNAPEGVLRKLVDANTIMILSPDSHGRNPLSYLLGNKRGLTFARTCARESDEKGRLLLHRIVLAGTVRWKSLCKIINLNPDALASRDRDGLLPFMLADTTTAFRLLLMRPDVVKM